MANWKILKDPITFDPCNLIISSYQLTTLQYALTSIKCIFLFEKWLLFLTWIYQQFFFLSLIETLLQIDTRLDLWPSLQSVFTQVRAARRTHHQRRSLSIVQPHSTTTNATKRITGESHGRRRRRHPSTHAWSTLKGSRACIFGRGKNPLPPRSVSIWVQKTRSWHVASSAWTRLEYSSFHSFLNRPTQQLTRGFRNSWLTWLSREEAKGLPRSMQNATMWGTECHPHLCPKPQQYTRCPDCGAQYFAHSRSTVVDVFSFRNVRRGAEGGGESKVNGNVRGRQ